MHYNIRVRRWVAWWFFVGIICGGIALANIFGRDLTGAQEKVLLLIGALHWVLGGIVCWAFDSVQIRETPPEPPLEKVVQPLSETEWHPASDFLLPGRRRSILPASVALSRRPRRSAPDSLPRSAARPLR
ncbi:MAG: hypothetical protein JWP63_6184 [Candidatus Solibacter sp.]|jgi:hypothetical protein|nr:hypothetical protein [Candidatus Solibacter sp.]